MKFGTNPGLVLGNFTALRSMSYSFGYNNNDNIREAKQKKKTPYTKIHRLHIQFV